MNNVLIYVRVSTDEQAESGFSLQNQEIQCKAVCDIKKYKVLDTYIEDYSAKTFDRPEWKKILAFLKANKGLVNKIIFLRWDRFSRNQLEALTTIKKLEKLNIDVECIEQPLDLSIPDNLLLLNIYLTVPQIENIKNSIRTTAGMRQASLNGCSVGTAPLGYDRDWVVKKSGAIKQRDATLIPNEKEVPIVLEIFNLFVKEHLSADLIGKELFKKYGKRYHKQSILDKLKNVTYIGKIKVKATKTEPEQIVKGYHPPIVSEELFYEAQQLLKNKTRKHVRKEKVQEFPLKQIIKCSVCGLSYTASITTKNNGQDKYPYYHCCKTKGHDRYPAPLVDKMFVNLLGELKVKDEIQSVYQKVLVETINGYNSEIIKEKGRIEKDIEVISKRITNTEDRLADGDSNRSLFSMLERFNNERDDAIMKHAQLKAEATPKEADIKYLMGLFNNFDRLYLESDYSIKKKLVSSIFPEPIYFLKDHFRTEKVNPLLELMFLKVNKLGGLKIETGRLISDPSSKAPPTMRFSNLISLELLKIRELRAVLPMEYIESLSLKPTKH